ncbi:uncharacterized protein MELLADRAFT_103982 [Melampsora larici-populina 98AG31]|uniref:Uncharacterized protein n=1 Tax=Melampsora larici-populina (strain 98AG31 / pathotype 3-4-7) TaxID=747676 RepID=F4RCB5_MELLP|nr:uncharacterized protein MELLADRAFT_103982 [Melampsora larici-populina 98AG31]EGG09853.1 hypothetical protein MELLADRAFT_103982 [Melampsora larici-populina 98AG31]
MNDEDRMHAHRVTPCCLRVAYSVDNLKGYIPVSLSDPGYLEELEREAALKMRQCRCSQCDPQGCARIIRLLPFTKAQEFDSLLKSSPTQPEDVSRFGFPKKITKRKFSGDIPVICKHNDSIRLSVPMIDLAVILVGKFEALFQQYYPSGSHMMSEWLFDREDAWQIVKNHEAVHNGIFLREILGGETVPGQFALVNECINLWLQSPVYHQHQQDLADEQIRLDQEFLDSNLIEEEHREQMRLKKIASDIKKAGIADRKRLRKQKEIEKQIERDMKLKKRQQELHSIYHTCALAPCVKTIGAKVV